MAATRTAEWPVINSAIGFVLFAVRGETNGIGTRWNADEIVSNGRGIRSAFKIIVAGLQD